VGETKRKKFPHDRQKKLSTGHLPGVRVQFGGVPSRERAWAVPVEVGPPCLGKNGGVVTFPVRQKSVNRSLDSYRKKGEKGENPSPARNRNHLGGKKKEGDGTPAGGPENRVKMDH